MLRSFDALDPERREIIFTVALLEAYQNGLLHGAQIAGATRESNGRGDNDQKWQVPLIGETHPDGTSKSPGAIRGELIQAIQNRRITILAAISKFAAIKEGEFKECSTADSLSD